VTKFRNSNHNAKTAIRMLCFAGIQRMLYCDRCLLGIKIIVASRLLPATCVLKLPLAALLRGPELAKVQEK
jgi:hypothetical protein